MRTDLSFVDNRVAIFTIGRQAMRGSDLAEGWFLEDAMRQADVSERTEIIEKLARPVVLAYRPELAGFVLYFINFNWQTQCWEFGLSHGSLPLVKMGDCLPKVPLDPDQAALNMQMRNAEAALHRPLANEVFQISDPIKQIADVPLPTQFAVAEPSSENSADWFRRVMSQPAE